MKRHFRQYAPIYLFLVMSFIVFDSSLCASDEQDFPGTNAVVDQTCANNNNIKTASQVLESKIVEVAELNYKLFLQKINTGEEKKFGFNNRNEIKDATIGNKPYQIYIKCQSTDTPTNLWRIPIIVQSEIRAFLTVDWVEDSWQAVDFGAAKLAEKISIIEDTAMQRYNLQENMNLHRIIIRDYTKRTDFFVIKSYRAEGLLEMTEVHTFPEVIQEQNEWCWTGVTAAIFDYFKNSVTQCEIAEYTRTVATWHDFGSEDCCINPNLGCNYWNYNYGSYGSIEDILESMQNKISIQNYGLSRKLTMIEVETDLSNNKPFVIRWVWDGGGGHFLVGYGIDENYLHYMNPWFGEGNKIGTYDWVSLGGGHTWTHTNRITDVFRSIAIHPSIMLLFD